MTPVTSAPNVPSYYVRKTYIPYSLLVKSSIGIAFHIESRCALSKAAEKSIKTTTNFFFIIKEIYIVPFCQAPKALNFSGVIMTPEWIVTS